MATIKLYDDYPYDTTFRATVVSVNAGKKEGTQEVVLDRTLFFPEEGGQTPDRGVLAGLPVVDVQIGKDDVITQTVQTGGAPVPTSLQPGVVVSGTIDWEHRYSNMQNHSGEHILSGLLHSMYGYENVGFRLSDHTVTLDTSGQLTDEQIRDLELRANDVIYQNVPITCEYPPPEVLAHLEYRSKKALTGSVRIVTIEGVDVCACCAPHVRHTGEIGVIKILNVVHNKHDMRLTIVSGRRALEDYEARQHQLEEVSHLTNYPQEKAADGVKKLLDDIGSLKEQLKDAQAAMLEMKLAKIRRELASGESGAAAQSADGHAADGSTLNESKAPASKSLWVFEAPMDPLLQRHYMNALCDMGFRFAGVFCGSDAEGWKYLIGSRQDNANVPNKVLRDQFHARGGGKPEMVQGSVAASQKDLESALKII